MSRWVTAAAVASSFLTMASAQDLAEHPFFSSLRGEWSGKGALTGEGLLEAEISWRNANGREVPGGIVIHGKRSDGNR